jgi:Acetyltransferase (GNAT) domain
VTAKQAVTATIGKPIRTALLASDDPRWAAILSDVRHDIYQLPEYVAFAARHQEPGTPLAFVASAGTRRLLIPLIVRPLPGDSGQGPRVMDATTPRGFPGPVVETGPPDADDFIDEALAMFVTALRERRIINAFIRLHPLLGPSSDVLARYGTVVDAGDSFAIDLAWSDAELWKRMRMNHRRDIARASKAGYRARVDTDWNAFDGFVAAFQRSMDRLDAAPHWRLERSYLSELRDVLGERIHLCVVESAGELASAALITETDGIAEYHLAGTFDEHVRASPSKLLIHYACGWARARGDRIFHLAGTPTTGDSLGHFKAGFFAERTPARSWRVIADPEAHAAVIRHRESRTGEVPDPDAGFFPAYRKPIAPGRRAPGAR